MVTMMTSQIMPGKRDCTMILGITGGIACGKSTVTEFFRAEGATIVSADELAREVVRPGSDVLQALVAVFGPEILRPDGELDRPTLAARIFADPAARAKLNRITHPAIAARAEARLQELRRQGVPLIVYEAPLLFEAGAEHRVDAVLVVTIDEEEQLARLVERDGLDLPAARSRIAAQLPLAEKVARADYVIDNSGTLDATSAQVRTLWQELQSKCARGDDGK